MDAQEWKRIYHRMIRLSTQLETDVAVVIGHHHHHHAAAVVVVVLTMTQLMKSLALDF
jgi:uncharacterized membrane protein